MFIYLANIILKFFKLKNAFFTSFFASFTLKLGTNFRRTTRGVSQRKPCPWGHWVWYFRKMTFDLCLRAGVGKPFSCKGPDIKYIWLCGHAGSVGTAQLCYYGAKAATDSSEMAERGSVLRKCSLQTWKSECHTISTSDFFQSLKNVNIILSSQAV